jgi:hypothetical protein
MPKPKGTKIVILSVRTDEEVRDAIKALSDAEDRTLSYYIDRLLREHIAAKGIDISKRRRPGPKDGGQEGTG